MKLALLALLVTGAHAQSPGVLLTRSFPGSDVSCSSTPLYTIYSGATAEPDANVSTCNDYYGSGFFIQVLCTNTSYGVTSLYFTSDCAGTPYYTFAASSTLGVCAPAGLAGGLTTLSTCEAPNSPALKPPPASIIAHSYTAPNTCPITIQNKTHTFFSFMNSTCQPSAGPSGLPQSSRLLCVQNTTLYLTHNSSTCSGGYTMLASGYSMLPSGSCQVKNCTVLGYCGPTVYGGCTGGDVRPPPTPTPTLPGAPLIGVIGLFNDAACSSPQGICNTNVSLSTTCFVGGLGAAISTVLSSGEFNVSVYGPGSSSCAPTPGNPSGFFLVNPTTLTAPMCAPASISSGASFVLLAPAAAPGGWNASWRLSSGSGGQSSGSSSSGGSGSGSGGQMTTGAGSQGSPGVLLTSIFSSPSGCSGNPLAVYFQGAAPARAGDNVSTCNSAGSGMYMQLLCSNRTSPIFGYYNSPACSGAPISTAPFDMPLGTCSPSGTNSMIMQCVAPNDRRLSTATSPMVTTSYARGNNTCPIARDQPISATTIYSSECRPVPPSALGELPPGSNSMRMLCVGGAPQAATFATSNCSGGYTYLVSGGASGFPVAGCQPSSDPGSGPSVTTCTANSELPQRAPTPPFDEMVPRVGIIGVFADVACSLPVNTLNTSITLAPGCTVHPTYGAYSTRAAGRGAFNITSNGLGNFTCAAPNSGYTYTVNPSVTAPTCVPVSSPTDPTPYFVLTSPLVLVTGMQQQACPATLGLSNRPTDASPTVVAVAGPPGAPICTSHYAAGVSGLVSVTSSVNAAAPVFSITTFQGIGCKGQGTVFSSVPASGCSVSSNSSSLLTFAATQGYLSSSMYHAKADCSDPPQATGLPLYGGAGGCTRDPHSDFYTLIFCSSSTGAIRYLYRDPSCSTTPVRTEQLKDGGYDYSPLGSCLQMPAGGGGYSGNGYFMRTTCTAGAPPTTVPTSPFFAATFTAPNTCAGSGGLPPSAGINGTNRGEDALAASVVASTTAFAPGNCLAEGDVKDSATFKSYTCINGIPMTYTFANSKCAGPALASSGNLLGCSVATGNSIRTGMGPMYVLCNAPSLPVGPMILATKPAKNVPTVGLLGVFRDSACRQAMYSVNVSLPVSPPGSSPRCSKVPGIGSGTVMQLAPSPLSPSALYNVSGWAVNTICAGPASATYGLVAIGVCTPSVATPTVPAGDTFILLAPTLTINSFFGGSQCKGDPYAAAPAMVAVAGLAGGGPICTPGGPGFSVLAVATGSMSMRARQLEGSSSRSNEQRNFSAGFALSAMPPSAFAANGMLTDAAVASLGASLQAAVAATPLCPNCTSFIAVVFNASSKAAVFMAPGQDVPAAPQDPGMPTTGLLVAFTITGPNASITAISSAPLPPSFLSTLAASLQAVSGWGSVTASLLGGGSGSNGGSGNSGNSSATTTNDIGGKGGNAPSTAGGDGKGTSTNTSGITISYFSVIAFTTPNCSGAPAASFSQVGDDACSASAAGSRLALALLTGEGAPRSASASPTPRATPTSSTTPSNTITRTGTGTPSRGASSSHTPSQSRTPSKSTTGSPTSSRSPTKTPTQTTSGTAALSAGASYSSSASETPTPSPTPSGTPPRTRTRTPTRTPTPASTVGIAPSATSTTSAYPSSSMSNLPSSSNSPTPSTTTSGSLTPGATPSSSPSPTPSVSAIAVGRVVAAVLNISMANTTASDALAATQGMLIEWLGLPNTTAATIGPFFDYSTTPPSHQGFSFTLLVPIDLATALSDAYAVETATTERRRELSSSSSAQDIADALTATVTAKSSDGSLAVAMQTSGVASSLGYDSTDSLLGALTVLPAVVAVAAAPTPSPTPQVQGSPDVFMGAFSLGALPASAYAADGKLTAPAVSALSNATTLAVASATGCTTCIATVIGVLDAVTKTVLFVLPTNSSRRALAARALQVNGLLVAFAVQGPSSVIAGFKSAPPPASFLSALTANVRAVPGWGAVSVSLDVPADPATSSKGGAEGGSMVAAAAGGAAGGVVVLGVLGFLLYRCYKKKEGKGSAVVSSNV